MAQMLYIPPPQTAPTGLPPAMSERPDWSGIKDRRRKRVSESQQRYSSSAPSSPRRSTLSSPSMSAPSSPTMGMMTSPASSPSSNNNDQSLNNRPSKYSKIDSKKYYTNTRSGDLDGAPPVPVLVCSACGAECTQPSFYDNKLVIGIEHGKECGKRPHGYFILHERDKNFAAQWRISHRHARRQIRNHHLARQSAYQSGMLSNILTGDHHMVAMSAAVAAAAASSAGSGKHHLPHPSQHFMGFTNAHFGKHPQLLGEASLMPSPFSGMDSDSLLSMARGGSYGMPLGSPFSVSGSSKGLMDTSLSWPTVGYFASTSSSNTGTSMSGSNVNNKYGNLNVNAMSRMMYSNAPQSGASYFDFVADDLPPSFIRPSGAYGNSAAPSMHTATPVTSGSLTPTLGTSTQGDQSGRYAAAA